ncbi:MAG: ribulose-phosphate 3-epimerase, partial [Bdellovibrionota bacterium]|nr:ribulose-phosphate 3-epimerase [Bdellovibrionota bacterium]
KKFAKAGISLKPGTDVDVLSHEQLKELDLILIMSVEPGFGGQKFMPNSLDKLKKLKKLKDENNYTYQLQIDGGINDVTCVDAKNAGADNLVAGSYIFKNNPQDYVKFVNNLR